MRISFDLDGVAWERPELFSVIAHGFNDPLQHEWGILAGFGWSPDAEQHVRERLLGLGYPMPYFILGRTVDYMHLNGAHFKSAMIVEYKIDLHFDDYDYDHPDTIRLFAELGQEHRVVRVRSQERREWSVR